MQTIWKYPLEVTGRQEVHVPAGTRHLSIQTQNDKPYLWSLVWPLNAAKELAIIRMYGTGHLIADDAGDYLGTFQLNGGELVFHAFGRVV